MLPLNLRDITGQVRTKFASCSSALVRLGLAHSSLLIADYRSVWRRRHLHARHVHRRRDVRGAVHASIVRASSSSSTTHHRDDQADKDWLILFFTQASHPHGS